MEASPLMNVSIDSESHFKISFDIISLIIVMKFYFFTVHKMLQDF